MQCPKCRHNLHVTIETAAKRRNYPFIRLDNIPSPLTFMCVNCEVAYVGNGDGEVLRNTKKKTRVPHKRTKRRESDNSTRISQDHST